MVADEGVLGVVPAAAGPPIGEPAQSDSRKPGHFDEPHEQLIPAAARQQRAVQKDSHGCPRGRVRSTPVKPCPRTKTWSELVSDSERFSYGRYIRLLSYSSAYFEEEEEDSVALTKVIEVGQGRPLDGRAERPRGPRSPQTSLPFI